MKTLIATATTLVIVSSTFAFGQSEGVQEEVAAAQKAEQAIITLTEQWNAVCASEFVLSEAAQTTCTTGEMPKPVKAGDRFPNRGIGTEFNTLIRQL